MTDIVSTDVAIVGAGPVILRLLDIEHGGRKHLDIADMIRMRVRDRHRLDIRRLDADLLELRGKRLRPMPGDRLRIGRRKTVGHRRHRIRNAGVPQEPACACLIR